MFTAARFTATRPVSLPLSLSLSLPLRRTFAKEKDRDKESGHQRASDIRKYGIIGAGQIGTGLAIVAAQSAGKSILLFDSEDACKRGVEFIDTHFLRKVRNGSMLWKTYEQIMERIETTTDISDFVKADLVMEAAVEDVGVKKDILRTLSTVCRPEVCLISTTSAISITELASVSGRPQKVIGMRFAHPVPAMELVEVIPGMDTSEQTIDLAYRVAAELEKSPCRSQDVPGFISSRILMPYINEAIHVLSEGVAATGDIDNAIQLGTRVPMGPLSLADYIGLDTCLSIMRTLHRDLGDPKYCPAPLLVRMVNAGRLGRKTKRGFFEYR